MTREEFIREWGQIYPLRVSDKFESDLSSLLSATESAARRKALEEAGNMKSILDSGRFAYETTCGRVIASLDEEDPRMHRRCFPVWIIELDDGKTHWTGALTSQPPPAASSTPDPRSP